jgi:hypothetical protein
MESVEQKESGLSRSSLILWACTPLPIVAHILPGRRVVVRPTLAAKGSIRIGRHSGANGSMSTAKPVVADAHCTGIANIAESRGEGRGGNDQRQ